MFYTQEDCKRILDQLRKGQQLDNQQLVDFVAFLMGLVRERHPLGFALADMDIEAFHHMRSWLEKALVGAGAEVGGSGMGLGAADVDIEMNGYRYNVTIVPLRPAGKKH